MYSSTVLPSIFTVTLVPFTIDVLSHIDCLWLAWCPSSPTIEAAGLVPVAMRHVHLRFEALLRPTGFLDWYENRCHHWSQARSFTSHFELEILERLLIANVSKDGSARVRHKCPSSSFQVSVFMPFPAIECFRRNGGKPCVVSAAGRRAR